MSCNIFIIIYINWHFSTLQKEGNRFFSIFFTFMLFFREILRLCIKKMIFSGKSTSRIFPLRHTTRPPSRKNPPSKCFILISIQIIDSVDDTKNTHLFPVVKNRSPSRDPTTGLRSCKIRKSRSNVSARRPCRSSHLKPPVLAIFYQKYALFMKIIVHKRYSSKKQLNFYLVNCFPCLYCPLRRGKRR